MRLRTLVIFAAAAAAPLAAQPDAAESDTARGRTLFLERGCVHCHAEASPSKLTARSLAGPDLRRVGQRLDAGWMARWVQDPGSMHEQARMPALLGRGEAGARDARDIAAYLGSLGGPLQRDKVDWANRDGEEPFVTRGCVACHRTEAEPADDRYLLSGLGAKTTPQQLAAFLRNPLALRPLGRMPDMQLSRGDAEAIAGFLCGDPAAADPTATDPTPAGDRARGAELVAANRCAACHTLPQQTDRPSAPTPLADLASLDSLAGKNGGCLAETPGEDVPRFDLTAEERGALAAFLREAHAAETPRAELDRRLAQLRCTACHERDGQGGMAPAVRTRYHETVQADAPDHIDPPPLTDLHVRMRPEWVENVLRGRGRARPYMQLRMPHYAPALTEGLAPLLAGDPITETTDYLLEDVENGRILVGSDGFSCVICHDLGGRKAPGARAPDLAQVHQRLRPQWLKRWIVNPFGVNPTTRMPTFFHGGKSSATHILDGDQDAQLNALLAYFAQGQRMRPPTGLGPAKDAVITATDHVRSWRTILPDLDARSLALGFPAGVSAAFDLSVPRLGYVWQGGFLDMTRKWTGRGDGHADLVGQRLVGGPRGSMFRRGVVLLDAPFAGYRIDAASATLRFDVEGARAEITVDLVECEVAYGLRLRVRWPGNKALEFGLGRPSKPQLLRRHGGRQLIGLLAHDDATCFARAEDLVVDQVVAMRVPADGAAEAVLWFPTSSTDPALQQCLEWSQ